MNNRGFRKFGMGKRINIILYILVLLIIACNAQFTPKRMSNIPKEAKWYGGTDGGCWILVQSTDMVNSYNITAYFDNTGEIWGKGNYIIYPEINYSIVIDSLMIYIEGFDGEKIHVNFPFDSTCQLVKTK